MTDAQRQALHTRLRRDSSAWSVVGSLPVLFFGDLLRAEVATVGLNPSDKEFLSRGGTMLAGAQQRFATLASLGARGRAELTDAHCDEAVEWMRGYYEPGKPVYGSWFNGLVRVLDGFGASFRDCTAAHLDLVQEATRPVWSSLPPAERAALLELDLPFLGWQIRAFPLRVVICTGKTVSTNVCRELGVVIHDAGDLALIKWWVGQADIDGRAIAFAGWNRPLARPTGLGREGEHMLGELLAERLEGLGL